MPPVKLGDFVRYVGDIQDLVRFIETDDQDTVRNILENLPILISDILTDGQVEIEMRANDTIHFFRVNEVDLRKIS